MVVAGDLTFQLGDQPHALSVGSYVVIHGELTHSSTEPKAQRMLYYWCVEQVQLTFVLLSNSL